MGRDPAKHLGWIHRISPVNNVKWTTISSNWWVSLPDFWSINRNIFQHVPNQLTAALEEVYNSLSKSRHFWYLKFPKFNMEPENDGFQVRNLLFQGAKISGEPCLTPGVYVRFSSAKIEDFLQDFFQALDSKVPRWARRGGRGNRETGCFGAWTKSMGQS